MSDDGRKRTRSSAGVASTAGRSVLAARSLVLNRSFVPVQLTSVRRACVMLYQGVAKAVDDSFRTFDFQDWLDLAPPVGPESLGLVGRRIRAPRVVALIEFDRIPRRRVRFSRANVFSRDQYTCQYCGRRFPRAELNLDHVIPRSQGGGSTWENIVCSCHACNRRKGGRTPEQSGFQLLRRPARPGWMPLFGEPLAGAIPQDWTPFLPAPSAGATAERAERCA